MGHSILPGVICLILFTAPMSAADLARINRTIVQEPVYKSKPKYCLLVFGPEAKTRVWLVQDGNTLYVDRNGNGDLTEAGEKVLADQSDAVQENEYTFSIGDIHDGALIHKASVEVSKLDFLAAQDAHVKALLAKNPKTRGYSIRLEMELPGWRGTGLDGRVRQHADYRDANGLLQFADRPQDAPIVHFGGPWQITLVGPQQLTVARERDVILGVGTPGNGPGTTAFIDYGRVVPETAYPTIQVVYPSKNPGDSPVHERYELTKRC